MQPPLGWSPWNPGCFCTQEEGGATGESPVQGSEDDEGTEASLL